MERYSDKDVVNLSFMSSKSESLIDNLCSGWVIFKDTCINHVLIAYVIDKWFYNCYDCLCSLKKHVNAKDE